MTLLVDTGPQVFFKGNHAAWQKSLHAVQRAA